MGACGAGAWQTVECWSSEDVHTAMLPVENSHLENYTAIPRRMKVLAVPKPKKAAPRRSSERLTNGISGNEIS